MSRAIDVAATVRAMGFDGARMLAPDLPALEEDLLWRMVAQVVDFEVAMERAQASGALRSLMGMG